MLTHRTFATEKPLHRTIFTHRFFLYTQKKVNTEKIAHTDRTKKNTHRFLARRNFTHNSFYTAETFPHRNLYGQFCFTHHNFYRQRVFLHGKVSAQKSYAQKVLCTTFFTYRRLYTQMVPLYGKRIAHRNLCTQRTFTRN